MSKRKLVITAITQMGLSQAEAARRYEVPEPTISRWMAHYRAEGPAAFEPRSRRPKSNPAATPPAVIEAILAERDRLTVSGHDAGPETISWHLQQTRTTAPSRATIARILSRAGRVRPEPKKKREKVQHHRRASRVRPGTTASSSNLDCFTAKTPPHPPLRGRAIPPTGIGLRKETADEHGDV